MATQNLSKGSLAKSEGAANWHRVARCVKFESNPLRNKWLARMVYR